MLTRTGLFIALALVAMLVAGCSSSSESVSPANSTQCEEAVREDGSVNIGRAVELNCADLVRTELNSDSDPALLVTAAYANSLDTAKVIIEHFGKGVVQGKVGEYSPLLAATGSWTGDERNFQHETEDDLSIWLLYDDTYPLRCSLEVAELLVSQGANVNAQTQSVTPLMRAARWGCIEIATLLVENGADVNAQNESGKTALHYSSRRASISVAELLIRAGADIYHQDNFGITPLDLLFGGRVGDWADWGSTGEKEKARWEAKKRSHQQKIDYAKLLIENGAATIGIDLSWMETAIPSNDEPTPTPTPTPTPDPTAVPAVAAPLNRAPDPTTAAAPTPFPTPTPDPTAVPAVAAPPTPFPIPEGPALTGVIEVDIPARGAEGVLFDPAVIKIAVGSTVRWSHDRRSASSSTSDPGQAEEWDSGDLQKGPFDKENPSFDHMFTVEGCFTYTSVFSGDTAVGAVCVVAE
jgi:plastocyanin